MKLERLPGAARHGPTWRTIGGTFEVNVTETAASALRYPQLLTMRRDITQAFTALCIGDDGTQRNPDHDVLTTFSGFVPARAVLAVLRLVFSEVPEINQGVQTRVAFQENTAAAATVTTVRPSELDVLFPPERGRSIAAVAGVDIDLGFVYEFHAGILYPVQKNPAWAGF